MQKGLSRTRLLRNLAGTNEVDKKYTAGIKNNNMNFETCFTTDLLKRLLYYKQLGDKTFSQLKEEDYFYKPSPESNSIAVIVQHIAGNMLSRFTNFLTEDGEKPWRNRDDEFEDVLKTAVDVRTRWEEGWHCVVQTIESLQPADLMKTIYIRTEALTVYDALLRQLAHYPYHTGQIVFIGKIIKDHAWQSLSIPKKQSNNFNQQMGMK